VALNILLDTNRLTDALRGETGVVHMLESATDVWVPFIVLGELKAGFLCGTRAAGNELLLHEFLRLPGVGVLFPDTETTDGYARLFAYLKRNGTPIPTNDLWIAALAVQHRLTLLSRDAHFKALPQVAKA
jgi:tRNA(fMet)-specific endonuclease VapC